MSRIFVVYGHHNVNKSFNQEIRDTFCSEAKKLGHEIDLINLHEEKPIPFYDGSEPSEQILDYRKRREGKMSLTKWKASQSIYCVNF